MRSGNNQFEPTGGTELVTDGHATKQNDVQLTSCDCNFNTCCRQQSATENGAAIWA